MSFQVGVQLWNRFNDVTHDNSSSPVNHEALCLSLENDIQSSTSKMGQFFFWYISHLNSSLDYSAHSKHAIGP